LKKENYLLIKKKDNFDLIDNNDEVNNYKKRKLNPSHLLNCISHHYCFCINNENNPLENQNELTDQILYNYLTCFFFQHISIVILSDLLSLKQTKYTQDESLFLKIYSSHNINTFKYNIFSTVEEEHWIITFFNDYYKHFICLLEFHKNKSNLAIKNLFKNFFSINVLFPVHVQRKQDYEIVDEYFKQSNKIFQVLDDNLIDFTPVSNEPIKCDDRLMDYTFLIYLFNNNNYFSNHGINFLIQSYEPQVCLKYLQKNYIFLYQAFIKLIFIYLSKVLYTEDYENLVVEYQMKLDENVSNNIKLDTILNNNSEKEKENNDDDVIIIDDQVKNDLNLDSTNEKTKKDNEKENDDDVIIVEEEQRKNKEDEMELEENSHSKIINDVLYFINKLHEIPLDLEYNNLYLYPSFIKDFRFINITKRYAISIFVNLDEKYFDDQKGNIYITIVYLFNTFIYLL